MKLTLALSCSLVALLGASSAQAKCEAGAKTLFYCKTTKGKEVEVCDATKTITYAFGKPGLKPELALSVPRDQASTSQWQGIGRYMSYSVDVPNGKTTYSVFWSVDRLSEKHEIEAGINVSTDGKHLTTVKCLEKGLVNNLEGVELKATE